MHPDDITIELIQLIKHYGKEEVIKKMKSLGKFKAASLVEEIDEEAVKLVDIDNAKEKLYATSKKKSNSKRRRHI